MFGYYIRLALKSFGQNPGLTALMVCAIALGIASCIMTITVYHTESADPIWWKSDKLFAVTLDPLPANAPPREDHPEMGDPQISFKDARYLLDSKIPSHKVMMFKSASVLAGGTVEHKPVPVLARVTSADFFTMFDTPFLYGGGWTSQADWSPAPVIVLSRTQNQRLFGGINSVGRTVRWHDREFRIVGVLDRWRPTPKFYDLNNYEFEAAEDVYVPIGWASVLQLFTAGNNSCWGAENLTSYEAYLQADCAWIQMWVELPDRASRERFQSFLANYRSEQHKAGRFTRQAERSRLYNVDEWLKALDVGGSDNRILVGLAGAFLLVCLINTVGLLLAKFMKSAPLAGIRRALGASRREIFLQHLTEVGVLSTAGALLSLVLGWLGMWGLRALHNLGTFDSPEGPPDLARIDTTSVLAAVLLAVTATLIAGLYPAWRAGRLNPAAYLKSQ
jgi:putative ABC transport system permease protein